MSAHSLLATDHDPFPALRQQVQATFDALHFPCALLQTAQPQYQSLYDIFLTHIDPALRQTYVCHACREFVTRYGGLITVADDGTHVPLLWPASAVHDSPFGAALTALHATVTRASITGVFLSPLETWGLPESPPMATGHVWTHLHIHVPKRLRYTGQKLTASQAMAEKKQDYLSLLHALARYPRNLATLAQAIIAGDHLYRGEHVAGIADWFMTVHAQLADVKHHLRREALIWRAVAGAPPGWCHIGTTMIGTLLDDLAEGHLFALCKSRFAAKMHPLRYQRPQAPPKDGTLDRAEKLVAQLGIARSLERRLASLDDIQEWVWRPAASVVPGNGVFAHLRQTTKTPKLLDTASPLRFTWKKFHEMVLPQAESMVCWVPNITQNGCQLTTAVHPDAPPILQWDSLDRRNPVAWYYRNGGHRATWWSLQPETWVSVVGIARMPWMWGDETPTAQHSQGIIVLLVGAVDTHLDHLGLFPETLHNDYREIRAVLEAYSQTRALLPALGTPACGLGFHVGGPWGVRLRVTGQGITSVYELDRWD